MEFLKNVWFIILMYFSRIHTNFITKVFAWQLLAYILAAAIVVAIVLGWYFVTIGLLLILGWYLYQF